MKSNKTMLFCGGDSRLITTAECFAADGYMCKTYCCSDGNFTGLEKLDSIDCFPDYVILPVPSFINNERLNCKTFISPEQMFSKLRQGTVVFGGMISEFIFRWSREYNLTVYDYAAREEFSQMNAVPTAEAAILCAANKIDRTIFGSSFSIIGYGRIGKALAKRLCALGGSVTVAARNVSALTSAMCDGYNACELSRYLSSPIDADVCFNTVPCRIISEKSVKNGRCKVFIDLASSPGGFCTGAEALLGDRLEKALSLPGKYSPVSAGEIIYKTVSTMINEIGG